MKTSSANAAARQLKAAWPLDPVHQVPLLCLCLLVSQ